MHPSHGKVETEKELDLLSVGSREGKSSPRNQVILELMAVLDHLDSKKDYSQENRGEQKGDQRLTLARLRRMNGERHSETTTDQHHSVDPAEEDIEVVTRFSEGLGIIGTIHSVPGKQPAKEQHLGNEKSPDAKRNRLGLLLRIIKLMGKCGMTLRQLRPPGEHSCTLLRSRLAFPESYRSVAVKAFATPGLSLARDWHWPQHRSAETTGNTPWESGTRDRESRRRPTIER